MSKLIKEIFYRNMRFYVFRDVYEPAEDTFLLAENLDVCEGERVLDVGTGCGILAILSALKASRVLATDINPLAIRCAKINARRNGVSEKIDFLRGDLLEPLMGKRIFDLVLFNAPYLPTDDTKPKEWIEYAWHGGRCGREVIDRFINSVLDHLKSGGRILMVQSSLSNIQETLVMLKERGFRTKVIDEKRFLFERIALIKAIKP